MPVFQLHNSPNFPPPELADGSGLLAVGGELAPDWIIQAYQSGIFPWFSEGEPIMWWSPDPRLVLFPDQLKVSKSMRPLLNQNKFRVTFDSDFAAVISACAHVPRRGQDGTWITNSMMDSYVSLHEMGIAHSVEVLNDRGELVGGIYGLALGKCFFGESMFAKASNASKFGFIKLVEWLKNRGFNLIDCQVSSEHLISLGAEEIPRQRFLELLTEATAVKGVSGHWTYAGYPS